MDGKLCPGIQTPLEIFTHSSREVPPPLIQSRNFPNPPFLKFWLESQPPPFRKGGLPTIESWYCDIYISNMTHWQQRNNT